MERLSNKTSIIIKIFPSSLSRDFISNQIFVNYSERESRVNLHINTAKLIKKMKNKNPANTFNHSYSGLLICPYLFQFFTTCFQLFTTAEFFILYFTLLPIPTADCLLLTPYSLLLTPYSLLLTPYSLLLTPYSLLLTPYSLLLTPYSLLLTPYSCYSSVHKPALLILYNSGKDNKTKQKKNAEYYTFQS